jgi:hypothetical protein
MTNDPPPPHATLSLAVETQTGRVDVRVSYDPSEPEGLAAAVTALEDASERLLWRLGKPVQTYSAPAAPTLTPREIAAAAALFFAIVAAVFAWGPR